MAGLPPRIGKATVLDFIRREVRVALDALGAHFGLSRDKSTQLTPLLEELRSDGRLQFDPASGYWFITPFQG